MQKHYRLAGFDLTVEADKCWMYEDDRMLAPFRVDEVKNPHLFRFHIRENLTPPAGDCAAVLSDFRVYEMADGMSSRYIGPVQQCWDDAHMRVTHRDKHHVVELKASVYPNGVSSKTVLNAMCAEHLIAREGGYILHASYIRWQNRSILFTAPSGTGKSTQATLWEQYRGAEIINGDRAAIRFMDGQPVADGIPFSGSSQICKNCTLPLSAVVYLGQAPSTTIRQLRGMEAFRRIWEGVSVNTWNKEDVSLVSDAVARTAQAVPVFYLSCTPDESAVIALERMLGK